MVSRHRPRTHSWLVVVSLCSSLLNHEIVSLLSDQQMRASVVEEAAFCAAMRKTRKQIGSSSSVGVSRCCPFAHKRSKYEVLCHGSLALVRWATSGLG